MNGLRIHDRFDNTSAGHFAAIEPLAHIRGSLGPRAGGWGLNAASPAAAGPTLVRCRTRSLSNVERDVCP
jgi:hypothetical protein